MSISLSLLLARSLALSLARSLALFRSLSLSLSLSVALSLFLSVARALSLSLTHTHSLTHSLCSCVAFAMGHHERLGAASRVAALDAGVVRLVLDAM